MTPHLPLRTWVWAGGSALIAILPAAHGDMGGAVVSVVGWTFFWALAVALGRIAARSLRGVGGLFADRAEVGERGTTHTDAEDLARRLDEEDD